MRTAPHGWLPEADTEALIKEARRRQRRRWLAVGAAVAAVLGGAAGVAAGVAGHPGSQPAAQAGAAVPAASNGCIGQPPVSSLPVWARSGFTPPDLAMPHVMGAAGNIVAILWATRDALHAPPLQDGNNKILWVSRIPLTTPNPMVITATLAGSTLTTTVSVPGGPVGRPARTPPGRPALDRDPQPLRRPDERDPGRAAPPLPRGRRGGEVAPHALDRGNRGGAPQHRLTTLR